MNPRLTRSRLGPVRLLGLLLCFALGPIPAGVRAQTSTNTVLGDAADNGLTTANTNLANAGGMTQAQFELSYKAPVLHNLLDAPMRGLAYRFARSCWVFYTSSFWQITVKSLLVFCCFLGLAYALWQLASGEGNTSKTLQIFLIKLAITAAAIGTVAPNFPFWLTTLVNTASAQLGGIADTDIVRYHQQAFMRRALLLQMRVGQVIENHISDQYYPNNASLTLTGGGGAAPEAFVPKTTAPDGQTYPKITYPAWLYVGPPEIGTNRRVPRSNPQPGDKSFFLVAPPQQPEVAFRVRGIPMLTIFSNNPTLRFSNPITAADETAVLRPFGAATIRSLKLYKDLATKWDTLQKTSSATAYDALKKTDIAAVEILNAAFNQCIEDLMLNLAATSLPNNYEWTVGLNGEQTYVASEPNGMRQDLEEQLRDFLGTTSTALKDDFANLKADEGTAWVFRNIMPIGLFFANAYIIIGIWLTPVLIPLWAAFFLLPPIFELSTALKKGAAVCVSFALYPFLIHLLVGFCVAFVESGRQLDAAIDPTGSYASGMIYSFMPSLGGTSAANYAAQTGARVYGAKQAAKLLQDHQMGLISVLIWLVILALLAGSPAIVAKMIMGIGPAEAITQPVQSTAITGGTMLGRGVLSGAARGAQDVGSIAAKTASTFRLPR